MPQVIEDGPINFKLKGNRTGVSAPDPLESSGSEDSEEDEATETNGHGRTDNKTLISFCCVVLQVV